MYPDDRIQFSPLSDASQEKDRQLAKQQSLEQQPQQSSSSSSSASRDAMTRAQEKRQKEKVRHAAEMSAMQEIRCVLAQGEYPMGEEAIMKLGLGDVLKMAIHYIDDLRWYLAYAEAEEETQLSCSGKPAEVKYVSEYGPHAPPKPKKSELVYKFRPRKRRCQHRQQPEEDQTAAKRLHHYPTGQLQRVPSVTNHHLYGSYPSMGSPLSSCSSLSSSQLYNSASPKTFYNGHGLSGGDVQQGQLLGRNEENILIRELHDMFQGDIWASTI